MNYPYRIVAIIYRMYERRGLDIPYFRTCMTFIGMLFLHWVILGLLLRLPAEKVFPGFSMNDSGGIKILKATIGFLLAIGLFFKLFKKQKVVKVEVSESDSNKAKWIVITYFMMLLVLMTLLLMVKGIRMGLITP
jgi:hypothetical protein